jgi:Dynein heavy chain, N-terminal region 2
MAQLFKQKVENMKATIPVVTYLRDKSLEPRHWEEIFAILEMRFDLNDALFTLNSLLELNVMQHKDKFEEIALKASQEKELEK